MYHRLSVRFQIVREAFRHLNFAVVLTELEKHKNDPRFNFYLLQVVCACGLRSVSHGPRVGSSIVRELSAEHVLSAQRMDWFSVLTSLCLTEEVIQLWRVPGICMDVTWLLL